MHSYSASPSDSEEERIAVETASRYGSKPNTYSSPIAEDVSVEVKIDDNGARMGADAELSILVKNLSSHPRQTTLHSQVAVMYYTGVVKGTIKKEQISVELQPNEGNCLLKPNMHKKINLHKNHLLGPTPHRKDHPVGVNLPTVPEPAGGPGRSDADSLWESQRDPAGVSQPDHLQAPHP